MAITFVVPVYKIKEEYLRKCLDSIWNQTCPDWEAILVDDGSPDNCGEICDEYAHMDSRFRSIHQENQGVSVARNSGIEETKTEWVTFVDPDDWIDNRAVAFILEALEKNSPDILSFGYAREFEHSSREEKLYSTSRMVDAEMFQNVKLAPLNRLIANGQVIQYTVNAIWNKVYRVTFLNEHHLRFEPAARKGQDRVFNLYALDVATQVYYLNKLIYHYRNDNMDSIVNRYNPNTVKNSQAVLGLMKQWIEKNNKTDLYVERLYCWTCTRLQEYMRLYYFHKEQPKSYHNVSCELKALIEQSPYREALSYKNKHSLTKEERLFIFFVKRKMFSVCKYLILLRESIKKIKYR